MQDDLEERFRAVVRVELPRLRRFAHALTHDLNRADDLVQGAMERMYVAWPRAHGVADPGAYLRTVVIRLAVNESRRPWRREHSTDVLPDQGHDTAAGSDLSLDLARALSALTLKQRAIVVMRYIEDRPVQEVAQVLGIAPGTVKRQSADAVSKLRRILGPDFLDDGDGAQDDGDTPGNTTAGRRNAGARTAADATVTSDTGVDRTDISTPGRDCRDGGPFRVDAGYGGGR